MNRVLALRLGRVSYGLALALQRRLHELRRAGQTPDLLLALEHEPVITVGRGGRREDLRFSEEELGKMGVEVFWVERGGKATYHGPGQLVLYPILNLKELGVGLREYVERLEEVMICTGQALGVELFRRPGFPGAWHKEGKVGFIGVHVRGFVSCHGLALNVNLDPNGFPLIVPCGMPEVPVVFLSQLVGRPMGLAEVEPLMLRSFSEVFATEVSELSGKEVRAWLNQLG